MGNLVTAVNLETWEIHHFDEKTTPEWAVAYGYCEQNNLMSALFSAAQDMRLAEFFKTLPLTSFERKTGFGAYCGDWACIVRPYQPLTNHLSFKVTA